MGQGLHAGVFALTDHKNAWVTKRGAFPPVPLPAHPPLSTKCFAGSNTTLSFPSLPSSGFSRYNTGFPFVQRFGLHHSCRCMRKATVIIYPTMSNTAIADHSTEARQTNREHLILITSRHRAGKGGHPVGHSLHTQQHVIFAQHSPHSTHAC